mmetsp:Transcript_57068/g.158912  ORF Transcript_57068/g.158912 Transcript_57068/m.158912 type:complete len:292 (-) Transcript_57068:125-1000(-)
MAGHHDGYMCAPSQQTPVLRLLPEALVKAGGRVAIPRTQADDTMFRRQRGLLHRLYPSTQLHAQSGGGADPRLTFQVLQPLQVVLTLPIDVRHEIRAMTAHLASEALALRDERVRAPRGHATLQQGLASVCVQPVSRDVDRHFLQGPRHATKNATDNVRHQIMPCRRHGNGEEGRVVDALEALAVLLPGLLHVAVVPGNDLLSHAKDRHCEHVHMPTSEAFLKLALTHHGRKFAGDELASRCPHPRPAALGPTRTNAGTPPRVVREQGPILRQAVQAQLPRHGLVPLQLLN